MSPTLIYSCDLPEDASDTESTVSSWDDDFSFPAEEREIQLGLASLPTELLHTYIVPRITNREIKSLRASCLQLALKLGPSLRFPRLFMSPSHRNIEVFEAVCAHPIFSKNVEEIVWDATILDFLNLSEFDPSIRSDLRAEPIGDVYRKACDLAFEQWPESRTAKENGRTCRGSTVNVKRVADSDSGNSDIRSSNKGPLATLGDLGEILLQVNANSRPRLRFTSITRPTVLQSETPAPRTWRGHEADEAYLVRYAELYGPCLDPPLTLKLSQAYLKRLVREQEDIVECEGDFKVLLKGIVSLTNLKRVRITTHTFVPDYLFGAYSTPLIRSLPYGFRMPRPSIPRGLLIFKERNDRDDMFGLSHGLSAAVGALRACPSALAILEEIIIESKVTICPEMELRTDKDHRATLHFTRGVPLDILRPRVHAGPGNRTITLDNWLRLAFPASQTPKLVITPPPEGKARPVNIESTQGQR